MYLGAKNKKMISLPTKEIFTKNNLPLLGGLLYAFVLPFYQVVATFAMVIWLILSIAFYAKNNTNNIKVLLPALLFFSYIFSMMYSDFSISTIQHKLSLLVFPIIFFFNRVTANQKKAIYKALVYGLFSASVTCLIVAAFRSLHMENGELSFSANVLEGKGFKESIVFGGNYFFGRFFSIFHQTVYFSLYLCAGISILIFGNTGISKKNKGILVFFFTIIIFLISNKAGFLVLALILLLKLITANYSPLKKILALFLFCIGLASLAYNSPRIIGSLKKLQKKGLTIDKKARYDYQTRLLSWDAAVTLIKNKPLVGYGPKESQLQLNKIYQEKGYVFSLKNEYNAHNQFLQIWLENGFLGLLVFAAMFVVLIIKAAKGKKRRLFYVASFLLLLVNAFFESYLNRFSGVSFFAFGGVF